MFPFILFPPLDRPQFFALDLTRFLDSLRNMSMSRNPPEFWHMRVPLLERVIIFQLLPLRERLHALASRSDGAPEANVAIVRSTQDVIVVCAPSAGEDALHSFGMVDVARMASIPSPQPDGPIITRRNQLLPRWRELDIHDGCDVIFENIQGPVQFPHVEKIYVVVFVGGGEVECFHRVPCQ